MTSARAAVASGAVRFPLDMYRYSETARRADARSRRDVANVMLELSQQLTLATSAMLLPAELDQALFRRFGEPKHLRRVDAFGPGVRHFTSGNATFPMPDLAAQGEDRKPIPPEQAAEFEVVFGRIFEAELLRAGPELIPAELASAAADIDQRYVDYENTVAANIRGRNLAGELLELAVRASDLGGIQEAVTEALTRLDLTWDGFIADLGPAGLQGFMDDLPTRYVTNVMRSAKLRQAEQPWEPNDFNDVLGLSVAAVYCDVVVTEKQWVHHLRRGKVDTKYSTELLHDVAALSPCLS